MLVVNNFSQTSRGTISITIPSVVLMAHRLRDRGEFVDLVLKHDVESFNVHRVIVCPQSKVFYKACTGGFEVTLPHPQNAIRR